MTNAQKAQARTNIGAGTSSFTGYTSSNKLHTDYINNAAGWTSNKGTVTSVRVQAGTGLSSSQNTAQTSTLNTTISIANGYKLPTTTEWAEKPSINDAYSISAGNGIVLTPTANGLEISAVADGKVKTVNNQQPNSNGNVQLTLDNINDGSTRKLANYSAATSSAFGLVKLGSNTVQSTAANSVTSTASRTYAVQKNSSGQLVVNVPWTTSSASIPSDLAKIVGSSSSYIKIERHGSTSYGMRIQTGKVSVNKAETINTEVKFPNSSLFSNTPVVILTPVINNTADTRQIDTELTGVTTTNFHFSCALGNTSYRITEVHYIAIQLI